MVQWKFSNAMKGFWTSAYMRAVPRAAPCGISRFGAAASQVKGTKQKFFLQMNSTFMRILIGYRFLVPLKRVNLKVLGCEV